MTNILRSQKINNVKQLPRRPQFITSISDLALSAHLYKHIRHASAPSLMIDP